MIDKQAFAAGVGLLAANFNKNVDAALSRIWFNTLSARMSTDDFQRAVERSIAEDQFWPTAALLIAKVCPETPETLGLSALEHVYRVLSAHGGHRFLPHDTYHTEFDEHTRAAISAIGGLPELANCTAERYASMARRFSKAYAESIEPQKRIAAAETDGRVVGMVGSIARQLAITSGRDRAAGRDA